MLALQPGRSYLLTGASSDTSALLAEFGSFDRLVINAAELDAKTFRDQLASLQLAATDKRLLLVLNAEDLSEIVQNMFLKLLEEPPSTLVIVFQTRQPHSLIKTVQSRLHPLTAGATASTASPELALSLISDNISDDFGRLAKLDRPELSRLLGLEMYRQRQLLLGSADVKAQRRIGWLDLAAKKLASNANQKLTLDWLLLHWSAE